MREAIEREAEGIELIRTRQDPNVAPFDVIVHEIHSILAELSGNEALRLFADVLAGLIPQYVIPENRELEQAIILSEEVHLEHVAIVDAVIRGDSGLARHRMSKHLDHIHQANTIDGADLRRIPDQSAAAKDLLSARLVDHAGLS